jgi:ABC-2 type transport system permease protein
MMRSLLAVARRVLMQFRHDPRTVAAMIVAPCLALWLFSALLGAGEYQPRIAAYDLPETLQENLEAQDVHLVEVSRSDAEAMLEQNELDAIVTHSGTTLHVKVEGSDASKTSASIKQLQAAVVDTQKSMKEDLESEIENMSFDIPSAALAQLPPEVAKTLSESMSVEFPDLSEMMPVQDMQTSFLHGSDDWTAFDFFGPVFIGIFIFVFVFITCSMSLLTERSGGTVRRLIATPVKSWQIVGGYMVSFSLIAVIQSAIILWVCIALIGFPNEGDLLTVAITTVSMALVSVTLGLLISGLARTPLQVIQLIIVFVVPQILLSGIFELSQTPEWMQVLAQFFPIYHGADAMRDVMLRGAGLGEVLPNIGILWAFIAAFFALASLRFRKKKARTTTHNE